MSDHKWEKSNKRPLDKAQPPSQSSPKFEISAWELIKAVKVYLYVLFHFSMLAFVALSKMAVLSNIKSTHKV